MDTTPFKRGFPGVQAITEPEIGSFEVIPQVLTLNCSPAENKMRNSVLTSWLPPVITAQADTLLSNVGIGLHKNDQWPGVLNLGTLKMPNLCSYLQIPIKLVRTRV